jgi:Nif-specific regulatory protein
MNQEVDVRGAIQDVVELVRAEARRRMLTLRMSSEGLSEVLSAVGALAAREIAIDDLLRRLVDRVAAALGAERGTIYLLDRARGELFSRVAQLPELPEIRLRVGQGVAGHVAATGALVRLGRSSRDERFFSGVDARTGYRTESMLAAPLSDRSGAVFGVLQLVHSHADAFADDAVERARQLADEAALILEATTLYEDLTRDRGGAREVGADDSPLVARINRVLGDSPALREASRLTARVATTEATVLLRGESGTGKELFARAVHVNSRRQAGPFVKIDCAALPSTLIENELFGHERGAYTGADQRAVGKLELARGGTIFLDELGELPLSAQGKLLRALQDRELERVGGTETVKLDVRVVAATNRDLEQMVEAGSFRADLYYRIRVVEVALPPLRERGADDIVRLARHFALTAARRHGRSVPTVSLEAERVLVRHDWPGNVRELENALESAVVVMDGDTIRPEHLALASRRAVRAGVGVVGAAPSAVTDRVAGAAPTAPPFLDPEGRVLTLDALERLQVEAVLARERDNQSEAARVLGIGRNTLARKLRAWR